MTGIWRFQDIIVLFVQGYFLIMNVGGLLDLEFPRRFGRCVMEDGLLTIQRMDLHQCVSECSVRAACVSISYRLTRQECKLLNNTINTSTALFFQHACVNVNKYDVIDVQGVLNQCINCHAGMTCNITSGDCYYSECPPLSVPDADVHSYMTNVGAWATISCVYDTTPQYTHIQSQCQADGTWSHIPYCPSEPIDPTSCLVPVAMITGEYGIPDSQIHASSSFEWYPASAGRLHNTKAWAADINTTNEYIQFDFVTLRTLSHIQTQGFHNPDEWVTSFEVQISSDYGCNHVTTVPNPNGWGQIFTGNIDNNGVMENNFYSSTIARCVRIVPKTWFEWPTIRVEIFGCPF